MSRDEHCPECGLPVYACYDCEHPCHDIKPKYTPPERPGNDDPVAQAIWDARGGPPPTRFRGHA